MIDSRLCSTTLFRVFPSSNNLPIPSLACANETRSQVMRTVPKGAAASLSTKDASEGRSDWRSTQLPPPADAGQARDPSDLRNVFDRLEEQEAKAQEEANLGVDKSVTRLPNRLI